MSLLAFSVASVFSYIGYILLAIIILLLMIMIHELGHYTAGKLLKFKINEFSIGFGKALFSKTNKSGEKISLRLIPLGGFCAFEGEDQDNPTNPEAFNNQKPWKRLIVLFMGAFFNLLSGIIFSVIFLTCFGYTDVVKITAIDSSVASTSLSELKVGDVVIAVDGKKCSFVSDDYFSTLVNDMASDEVFALTIKRDGKTQEILVAKSYQEEGSESKKLGVMTTPYKYGFFEALGRAIPFTFGWAWKVLVILFSLITGKIALNNIGGPIATVSVIASAAQMNIANIFLLLPLISANLAVFNLLPFPSLDGARMVFVLIEWIRGKPINRKVEGYIHTGGLIFLFSFIIIVDLLFFIL